MTQLYEPWYEDLNKCVFIAEAHTENIDKQLSFLSSNGCVSGLFLKISRPSGNLVKRTSSTYSADTASFWQRVAGNEVEYCVVRL